MLSVDGFGADITANPIVKTSYAFTGRESDAESGLYYYRARFYDPLIGRFLQKDPHPGTLTVPSTIVNSYAYCGNNPANNVDPSGMTFLNDLFIGIVSLAALTTGVGFVMAGNRLVQPHSARESRLEDSPQVHWFRLLS